MSKIFTRLCSLILSAVMLLQMIPAQPVAAFMEAAMDTTVAEATATAEIEEVTTKRTEYTKEFKMSDGLHMAVVYPDAVHYEQGGQWLDIDNTLQLNDAAYTNTAGPWQVQLPQHLSGDHAVSVEKDGYTLRFAMTGQLRSGGDVAVASLQATPQTEAYAVLQSQEATAQIEKIDLSEAKAQAEYPQIISEKLQSRLRYESVYAGTDVVYDLSSNILKESIVMDSYDATLRGYRYSLDVGSLQPVLQDSGEILLYDESEENIILTMPAPYLVDNAGVHCADVTVALTGSGSSYTLSYYLPQQWLAEEDRAWPVVLDPVITANTDPSNILDQTVCEKKTFSHTWAILQAGYYSTEGISRAYLKYQNLPTLTSADVIVSAQLQLLGTANYAAESPVFVHKVSGTWDSTTITWANKPAHIATAEDYAMVKDATWYTWDVTDIARGWYAGENTGMMFKMSDAVETAQTNFYRQLYSSDCGPGSKPTLTIIFRNNNGLEGYWDYTTVSAGRAGTGYINNYTGNLVWVHEDLGFGGNRMPVSISHIYNANDSQSNRFGLGWGWRTNYNQLVYQWPDNTAYYVWEDGDGTKHYFKNVGSGKYEDEDGLELTLTVSGSNKIITDKYGNTSHFDSYGRLYKLENNQATKSSIHITYTTASGYLLSTITDGAGRVYRFTFTSDLLRKIEFLGKGTTALDYLSFSYTNSQPTTITYKDGKKAVFYYPNQRLMQSAENVDAHRVCFLYNTYESGKPSRVRWTGEYQGMPAVATGSELSFEYANNQTTITDYKGNQEILQFNNWGNTLSIQDGLGRAQYAKYATDENQNSTANQLQLSSKLQNTVTNLILDGSFEYDIDPWKNISATGITHSHTTETAFMGNKSLKVVRSDSGGLTGVTSGGIKIPVNATYTFSVYLKTDANTSVVVYMTDGTISTNSETIGPNSDWTRVELSYTNNGTADKYFNCRAVTANAGTFYMDCAQLERTYTASRYNLVENNDFRTGCSHWYLSGNCESTEARLTSTAAAEMLDANVYSITGNPSNQKRLSQNVYVKGNAGDTFVLSGWAKGDSAPLIDNRKFGLIAVFNNTDGSKTEKELSFNPDTDSSVSWQYAAAPIVAEKAYSSITVHCAYDYNVNSVQFDGIQLFKEEFGSSYTYDADGNVTSIVDLQKKQTRYEYANNNLTKEILPSGAVMTYTYDNYHNVKTATSAEGQVYSFNYDTYGNNTSVSISGAGTTITSTAAYTADGNRLASTTDALGKVTTYNYDENTNVLHSVKYPEDTDATKTNYTYDSMYRVLTASTATDTGTALSASYTYTGDKLTALTTGSTTYSFTYGHFGVRTNISVGSRSLASYSYDSRFDQLLKLDYGNGDLVQYTYDTFGRLTGQSYEDGASVSYLYDNESNLASVYDSETGITTKYYYDFLGRALKTTQSASNYSHALTYSYDSQNRLTQIKDDVPGLGRSVIYAYNDDNQITSVKTGSANSIYTYDALGRVTQQQATYSNTVLLTDTYTYHTSSAGAATGQVATKRSYNSKYDKTLSYTYDDNGNILTVSDGTYTTKYTYDSANQLIREDNQALLTSWTYSYDNAGNIKEKKEYAYTTGSLGAVLDTISYTYGDSSWKDLLTGYDGATITSDTIGNMLSDGTWSYTWKHGRQLASMSDGTSNWTFTYDADGMRIGKTNGTTTYEYYYRDSQLSALKVAGNTMCFGYDADGTPVSVLYNGAFYYYVTNLQGDVIAIVDSGCNVVVNYVYDAWGNILFTSGSKASTLGVQNPLRYRGYVYDQETGLYYLQSRYYSPEIGRFISADGQMSTPGGELLGHNQFSYCFNNPVNMDDSSGNWPSWSTILKAAAIAVTAVAVVAATAVTITTFGLASVAATIVVSSAITVVAKTFEVAVLQGKKSTSDGKDTGQVASDIIESVFDNGIGTVVKTVVGKSSGYAMGFYSQSSSFQDAMQLESVDGYNLGTLAGIITHEITNRVTNLKQCVSVTAPKGSLWMSYGLAGYNVLNMFLSIFAEDPVQRATSRGYTLK